MSASRRQLARSTVSTAALAIALAFGLLAGGALAAQLGLAQRSERESAPEADLPFCEEGRLQDAYRINLDEASDRFGQCAQICLSPSLKGVAANHGVLFGSKCPQLGCRDRLDETEKSGQRVIFFACPLGRRPERRSRGGDEPQQRESGGGAKGAPRADAEPSTRAASAPASSAEPFLPDRSALLGAGSNPTAAAQTRRAFRAKLQSQGH